MKKTLLVLPLTVLLVNCSTSKNTQTVQTSDSTNSAVAGYKYYQQNPAMHLRPAELEGQGGWSYNTDWRRNTNVNQELSGTWELTMTPEVATAWRPDKSSPESYASYWTPEAVQSRQQTYISASATMEDNSMPTSGLKKKSYSKNSNAKKTKSSKIKSTRSTTNADAMNEPMNAEKATSSDNATMNNSGDAGITGSTGSDMGGLNTNAAATTTGALNSRMAVNGNNFLMPRLSLNLERGSFIAFTGCNNMMGNLKVDGNMLHFQDVVPSGNVECSGGFDQSAFIDMLRRVDSYDMMNGQVRLKKGEQVLMVLAKNGQ